ncbi:NDR1/HIN1-like protein 10 isoform X2 [Juglans microcarpa x Juglans regia]|uniref:NDR1/HIN1-like protein 10 isoform X2 n=1 Tax=Juglans microcarpa x Juglans regia TaxID=2249226 RepID=UPI001B7ECA7A|nr:NDR1/HIN1-like protein 10 isoform X2 [Juglans microcarpa x Juglans regia]
MWKASLTQFNFTTTNNTLNYKLALNITLRNYNKRVGVHYDGIEAVAYYRKKWFSTVRLTPFYQGHKNTSILSPIFEGQQVLSLRGRDLSKFELEKSVGAYSIDVKLSVRIRIKYGKIKTARFKPRKIDCPLKVYLSTSNGTAAEGFRTTKCGNVHFFSDPVAID